MSNFAINFSHPWLLLLLVPAVGLTLLPYLRMNRHYRRNRNRITSIVLHLIVMTLSISVLAGMTFAYDTSNDANEIILLVDASHSSSYSEEAKDEFVLNVLGDSGKDFKIGIVKFGYDQKYAAPMSNDTDEVYRNYLASEDPDTSATDIAAALTYASELISNPGTSKIVLVTDGIETDGNAMSVIRSVSARGTKVDVYRLENETKDEIQISGVELPDYNLSEGVSFPITVKLTSNFAVEGASVNVNLYDNGELKATAATRLGEGMRTVEILHTLSERGFHEFRFEITGADGDTVEYNNSYYSYVNLYEFKSVLMLEAISGESDKLLGAYAEMEKDVTLLSLDSDEDRAKMPSTLTEIGEYDQLVLVNVANSDLPEGFDRIMFDYVYTLGGDVLTVGGENDKDKDGNDVAHAYNRNDLRPYGRDSLYQQMLPVQAVDYTPPIAVVVCIDTSGSMSNKIQNCKNAATVILDTLNPWDYMGVMTFSDDSIEQLEVTEVTRKNIIQRQIDAISNFNAGGTLYTSAVVNAGQVLSSVDAPRKHIILITDGGVSDDDMDNFSDAVVNNYELRNITLSILIPGESQGKDEFLGEVVGSGHGKLYKADPDKVGDIAFDDLRAQQVSEIDEKEFTLRKVTDTSYVTLGVTQEELNEIKFAGYYGTRLKDSATAPLTGIYGVPMYAHWTFGKGKVGSFMSDLGGRWSGDFLQTDAGKTILNNLVTGLFPSQPIESPEMTLGFNFDNYTTQVNVYTDMPEGCKIEIEVAPVTKSAAEYYEEKGIEVTASDSFTRFSFDVTQPGIYTVTVTKSDADGNEITAVSKYVTLSYSREYDMFEVREVLPEDYLSGIAATGNGAVLAESYEIFVTFDRFVRKLVDPRIAFLIIAIILILLDIAVRKFKFKWIHEIVRDRKATKAMRSGGRNDGRGE